MLFGDKNELDIDGRNCNGDMYGTNIESDLWIDDVCSPRNSPSKLQKLQFNSVDEMLQSAEVRNLIQKTIECKNAQITALQNELLEFAHQIDVKSS